MAMKQGTYKELFDGIKQCMICGFVEAPAAPSFANESKLHSICHNRYLKSKEEFGENLLSYDKLLEAEKGITELRSKGLGYLKSMCSSHDALEYLLAKIYSVQFTKSIKFWDYFRPHPKYDDYVTLLWNTPSFIRYISSFIDKEVIDENIKMYRSNRKLIEKEIFVNEFVFLNVEECVNIYSNLAIKDLSNEECVNTYSNLAIKDLSYLDTILNVDCEDEDSQDSVDEDVDAMANLFTALVSNIKR